MIAEPTIPGGFVVRILYSLILLLLTLPCLGNGRAKIDRSYRKAAKRYRFELKSQVNFPRNISGEILPVSEVENELGRFFAALDELETGFVRKSGLRKVVICKNLKLNGMACAGVARGDCIYLAKGFSKRVVYHEMFHIFDPSRDDKAWQRLNHKDFRYRGINFPDRPISKKQKKKLQKHYSKVTKDFSADFVSRYAQSSEVEDRAETFACMIDEGRYFLMRAKKSPVLRKKMQYLVDLTDRSSLLGKEYWKKKFGKDVLKNSF